MKFPIKTIIVENEAHELIRLKKLLLKRKDIFDIVSEVTEYRVAVATLKQYHFDLSIFDIYLDEGKDCYDLINEVGRKNLEIIALTSQQKTVHPGKAHVFVGDCLWFEKPYISENVLPFIEQVKEQVLKLQESRIYEIPVPGGKNIPLRQDKICFIKGSGKQTNYYVVEKENQDYKIVTSTETIEKVIERLSEDVFVQVHRSYLFNIHFYKGRSSGRRFGIKMGGVINTEVPSKIKIPFSKKYLSALLQKLRIEE